MMRVSLNWQGSKVTADTIAAGVRGLRHGTEHLLTASRKVVPLEEATLERSGTATVDEAKMTGAVAYDTPYAVVQHERLDFRHQGGRTAKYLETPAADQADAIRDLIAAQIRRALRG